MKTTKTVLLDKIAVVPAYKIVSDAIERQIMQGVIKAGDALPSEASLAEQFGVNRSTVREGIRLLEQNGLVRRKGSKRLFASVPQYDELGAHISRALVLHEVTFLELWETMLALEPEAAALAAERATGEEIAALDDNLLRTHRSLANSESLVELDIEFHYLIAKAANNRALLLAREPLSQLFYPAFYNVMSRLNAGGRLLHAHEKVVEGVRAGDARAARSWMERHIIDFRRGYELANLDINSPINRIHPPKTAA